MLKKILLNATVFCMVALSVNVSFAQEVQFKETVIRLSSCQENCQRTKPCPVSKSCDKCKKSPCECKKHQGAWKNSDCCDKDIKALYEYFNNADCFLSLTCEQQQKSNEIKGNASREITELKREIATKQSELLGLNSSSNCNKSKETRKLNRDIRKLQKNINKVKKNAKKDYKKMLNSTQKQMYRNYKKSLKAKGVDNCCPNKQISPCEKK